ncbi:MAG TPA: DNA polymerase I [Verrucomicrobiales bacterium]|nr:DNA polymerase I [Verrucomicrobiales bacterium]
MSQEKRLFLLDGMALIYRAHFAFITRPILTSYGMNTSALYGFTNTLLELIREGKPTHIAVAFDTAAPTARHTDFPAYKGQREEMPEDLSKALPHMKRIIEAFRIPVLEKDGYEADDIIGTLARRAEAEGFTTWMVTADKDFAQLVDANTFIWKPGRQGSEHEIIGVPQVQAQWQVDRPEQVIDVLGLWGDSVDNFPGVPGIGEKTAKALIKEWGSIENLLANTDKLKGKQKENLIANAEQARLCRKLATIWIDSPVGVSLEELVVKPLNEESVRALMVEFEFTAIGKRLFGDNFKAGRGFHRRAEEAPPVVDEDLLAAVTQEEKPVSANLRTLADTPHTYEIASTPAKRLAVLKKAAARKEAGFHMDMDPGNPRDAKVRGIALATGPGEAHYLTGADSETLLKELSSHLSGSLLTGHDLKDSLQSLVLAGADLKASFFDTMLAHSLVEPEQRQSLTYLCEALLGYTPGSKAAMEKGGQMLMPGLDDGEALQQSERAMERADVAQQLAAKLRPQLITQKQERVFYEIEAPLLPVLADMEAAGIKIDTSVLRETSVLLEKQIKELEEAVYAGAGTRFNMNSPKQLGQILFDQMKLVEKPKKTKTGQYVTSEDVLAELAGEHRIVADLLAFREASKLKSTYVDALPNEVSRRTGRVHTTYMQASTSTGRLASYNPNLQNIPIRTEQGRAIRKAFVADGPDMILLSADYSQIELRVMASISADSAMMEAFHRGIDIHQATAARVHGVLPEDVTTDMRRAAKMVNFGIIYGISAFGLSQRLGIPRVEGGRLIEEYFNQYPGVKSYMDRTIEMAKEKGYVETVTGRRRYLRDIRSANAMTRKAAERTAINTPIQGSAADMIKIAMVNVAARLRETGLKCRMLLQVHDELVFELPASELTSAQEIISTTMRDALKLSVPVVVEMGSGKSWFEAHA